MNRLFDRLNLRPFERRLVIGIMVIVFIVVNVVWVWPHFKDWGKTMSDLRNARENYARFTAEIKNRPAYEAEKGRLEESGGSLLQEEMVVQIQRLIQNQATQSGIVPNGMSVLPSPRENRPDRLFDEISVKMGFVNAEPEHLLDFLYNISAGRSQIRVKDLSVRPDQPIQKLVGEITLTASYQKKAPGAAAKPKPEAKAPQR